MALLEALRAVSSLAVRGIPAVRSGVFGARVGAGTRFGTETLERLGLQVARPVVKGAAALAQVTGIQRAGVGLAVKEGGALAATVSEELVATAGRATVRTAIGQIGRATFLGALGGAAVDAVVAGVKIAPAVRDGSMDGRAAALHVGKHAARGAAAGAAGVAAAGVASAVVAAAGITLAGAPVVVPLAAMVAAGTLATRAFDRKFGAAAPAPAPELPSA